MQVSLNLGTVNITNQEVVKLVMHLKLVDGYSDLSHDTNFSSFISGCMNSFPSSFIHA